MRNRLTVIVLTASAFVITGVAITPAQTQQSDVTKQSKTENSATQNRVLGEVMTIDAPHKQLSLKTADGKPANVTLNDNTVYRRVPPGEINLDKAASISLEDIAAGDRVLVKGKLDESFVARVVIVMSKSDLAEKRARDREAWLKRGVSGVITALNPEKKDITLRTSLGASPNNTITAVAAEGGTFRRYSGSVKFKGEAQLVRRVEGWRSTARAGRKERRRYAVRCSGNSVGNVSYDQRQDNLRRSSHA